MNAQSLAGLAAVFALGSLLALAYLAVLWKSTQAFVAQRSWTALLGLAGLRLALVGLGLWLLAQAGAAWLFAGFGGFWVARGLVVRHVARETA